MESSMRISALVILVSLVAGCATGYQAHTWSGGYKDSQLGENHYLVEYYGNGTTSPETVDLYWKKRAEELCASGYEIVSDETGATNGGIFIGATIDHPWQKAEIKCK
tara:strand:+ start:60 stop:380 length:321 start_codon:yes stop_codon:yes gene_type:complete